MTKEEQIYAEIARRKRFDAERRRWREDERTPGTDAYECAAELRSHRSPTNRAYAGVH